MPESPYPPDCHLLFECPLIKAIVQRKLKIAYEICDLEITRQFLWVWLECREMMLEEKWLIKNEPQIIGIDIFTIFRKLNNSNLFLYDENETIKLKLNIKLSLVIKLFFHTLAYLNLELEAILNGCFGDN